MGSVADHDAYHCLVEGIEFYPLLLRVSVHERACVPWSAFSRTSIECAVVMARLLLVRQAVVCGAGTMCMLGVPTPQLQCVAVDC